MGAKKTAAVEQGVVTCPRCDRTGYSERCPRCRGEATVLAPAPEMGEHQWRGWHRFRDAVEPALTEKLFRYVAPVIERAGLSYEETNSIVRAFTGTPFAWSAPRRTVKNAAPDAPVAPVLRAIREALNDIQGCCKAADPYRGTTRSRSARLVQELETLILIVERNALAVDRADLERIRREDAQRGAA